MSFSQIDYNGRYVRDITNQRVCAATEEPEDTVIGFSDKEVDIMYCLGFDAEGLSLHAIKLSKDMLQSYVGQSISAVMVGIGGEMHDITVFVREELEGENVASGTIRKGQLSWNYGKLDNPYIIPEGKDVYVGYSYQHSGEAYLIGLDTSGYADGSCYLGFIGQGENYFDDYSAPKNGFGKLLIAAIVGNDIERYGNSLTLQSTDMGQSVPLNTPFEAGLKVANTGWNSISEAEVQFSEKNSSFTQTVYFEPALKQGETAECVVSGLTVGEDQEVGFDIVTVNGKEKNYASKHSLYMQCKVYEGEGFRKSLLVEQYTGQMCGNCPNGNLMIMDLIKGNEERFVWVAYHSFLFDNFCNEESIFNSNEYQGGTAAPIMMLNRTYYNLTNVENNENMYALTAHPTIFAYTNSRNGFVDSELSEPARISIDIDQVYDRDEDRLDITVSGKRADGYLEDKNLALTVYILEDGQVSYQSGATENYVHNNIMRNVLSDKEGDVISFDADGNYSMEYSFMIPSEYVSYQSNITTYPNRANMKIAAFVSNKGKLLNDRSVFNACQQKFTEDAATGTEEINNDSNRPYFIVGNAEVMVYGDYAYFEMYDMSGMKVGNANLAEGIYIIRITDRNGNVYADKVFIR